MYTRNIQRELRVALSDTPVVLLNGARQTGKTTLVKTWAISQPACYITLDNATQLSAARGDPHGFIVGLAKPVIIDEVQKAPGLFPAIKMVVDQDREPGGFLLTGSANILLLPKVAESLAGRMEIITLWPLSQGELRSQRESFIDRLFTNELTTSPMMTADGLQKTVLTGSYPEVLQRTAERRREAWFTAYLTALLERDIRDLSNVEGLTEIPQLLSLLASRLGGLLNQSELSRRCGIPNTTLKRYLGLLQATFLYQPLPAWSNNLGKRLLKSPKIHLIDSGLAAHLAGVTHQTLQRQPQFFGHLLETFVVAELRKQLGWSSTRAKLFHYRTTVGREVDIVLADAAGQVVGIEVKAAATVSKKDFVGLQTLQHDTGSQYLRGIVLYTGVELVQFDPYHCAVPIQALWAIATE